MDLYFESTYSFGQRINTPIKYEYRMDGGVVMAAIRPSSDLHNIDAQTALLEKVHAMMRSE